MARRAALLLVLAVACGEPEDTESPTWTWDLLEGVPAPRVPADNPMSTAKVELGRALFFDEDLSGGQDTACASCHHPELAFAESEPVSVGPTGQHHPRNAPGLGNVAYASTLTWANPVLTRLETQNPIPLFGEHPIEMGVLGREDEVLGRLEAKYGEAFAEAFPESEGRPDFDRVVFALAAFQRTLLSFGSPFDAFQRGDHEALSEAARRGMELFFSERLECFHCHGGFLFSDALDHDGNALAEKPFHNTGLYNLNGSGGYPLDNTGLHELTGRPEDMGFFRAPSLRNVAVTAPYMHDGSVATLEEVVEIYARGGRLIEQGPRAGDGRDSPLKSPFVSGFELSEREKADLVEFLRALTDPHFLSHPDFQAP